MRTALLEMRTALLESVTTKSMRVNDKNNFVAAKVYSLQMSHASEHSESEFYYPGELSRAELFHQSPTHSESKKRNLTLLANEEAHNFLSIAQNAATHPGTFCVRRR